MLDVTGLSLGQAAFEAYKTDVGGSIYDGKPIPSWDQLADKECAAWEGSAAVVIFAYNTGPQFYELRNRHAAAGKKVR